MAAISACSDRDLNAIAARARRLEGKNNRAMLIQLQCALHKASVSRANTGGGPGLA